MKSSLSNSLVIISTIFTLISFQNSELLNYGMHSYYLQTGDYTKVILQFCLYSFLHANIPHLLFNSLFLFLFGNKVEASMSKISFLAFFLFSTIFNGICILFLSQGVTVGISGFGMALLGFYTFQLYEIKDPDYKGGITGIVIGSIIGFTSNISIVGHFFGAVSGGLYYLILKKIKGSK